MRILTFDSDPVVKLPAQNSFPKSVHVFDEDSICAINAALAAGRPLLVRGEPGTGKSQLARAAAAALGRAFLPFTVDARTEARDLLYSVDTVARLAEAQILGHLPNPGTRDVRGDLAERNFTSPGPIWWAFDWGSAAAQAKLAKSVTVPSTPEGWTFTKGAVLLLDEIDKADPSVPNGLLEALGQRQFATPWGETIAPPAKGITPFVVITTNEERSLPDAFVRRCLVLSLSWPNERSKLEEALVARGGAHFPRAAKEILQKAAEMVADDREIIAGRGLCPPGGAEYLDLLKAVLTLWPKDRAKQREGLDNLRAFALRKHPTDVSG